MGGRTLSKFNGIPKNVKRSAKCNILQSIVGVLYSTLNTSDSHTKEMLQARNEIRQF